MAESEFCDQEFIAKKQKNKNSIFFMAIKLVFKVQVTILSKRSQKFSVVKSTKVSWKKQKINNRTCLET